MHIEELSAEMQAINNAVVNMYSQYPEIPQKRNLIQQLVFMSKCVAFVTELDRVLLKLYSYYGLTKSEHQDDCEHFKEQLLRAIATIKREN